jgi:nitroreductase/NAD-dependent dihydropyrimidine dehydrogenase PreA subunit
MARTVTTRIDGERCTGCGRCVEVCPSGTLSMEGGKAVVSGDRSLNCGHCMAVCPVDAVRVGAIDGDTLSFVNFDVNEEWIPYGAFDTARLVQLMASRRSCRNYLDRPVDRSVLEDLVKAGITAPSGTNSQTWTFTLLPTREAMAVFAGPIADFYRRLNRLARNPLLRGALRIVGRPELAHYYRDHHDAVEEGLRDWEEKGKDPLFHGAPAAIVVATRPGASCPTEDALLASQNILLAAHSMGLGTCLIGFAVEAMNRDHRVKRAAGIPREESVHAVIALGHPDEEYQRIVGRLKPVMRTGWMPGSSSLQ